MSSNHDISQIFVIVTNRHISYDNVLVPIMALDMQLLSRARACDVGVSDISRRKILVIVIHIDMSVLITYR